MEIDSKKVLRITFYGIYSFFYCILLRAVQLNISKNPNTNSNFRGAFLDIIRANNQPNIFS